MQGIQKSIICVEFLTLILIIIKENIQKFYSRNNMDISILFNHARGCGFSINLKSRILKTFEALLSMAYDESGTWLSKLDAN